jgi:hypothetical protein
MIHSFRDLELKSYFAIMTFHGFVRLNESLVESCCTYIKQDA